MGQLDTLTKREYEVLILLSHGQQNKEIALALSIAEHTVEQHLKHIYQKLGVSNRTEAGILFRSESIDLLHSGNPL
jgi:DNA-binding NarL/FixJ family response regulator